MILSFASEGAAGGLLGAASLAALLAYGSVAVVAEPSARQLRGILLLAWLAHLGALVVDVLGWGAPVGGARFGFAPALSMTVWLVWGVYLLESRWVPLAGVRRVLALLACAVLLLAWLFPGEPRPLAASPWAPLHWVLGLASYGLFGVAVLHASLLSRAERALRLKQATPMGMPLLRLERITFQFVGAGVGVLSLALLLGWWFSPQWRWDHKTLLSVLGWLVLTGLLVGRQVLGWRGQRAIRWLYAGAGLLLLSYAGSRFVLEVILQRAAVA